MFPGTMNAPITGWGGGFIQNGTSSYQHQRQWTASRLLMVIIWAILAIFNDGMAV